MFGICIGAYELFSMCTTCPHNSRTAAIFDFEIKLHETDPRPVLEVTCGVKLLCGRSGSTGTHEINLPQPFRLSLSLCRVQMHNQARCISRFPDVYYIICLLKCLRRASGDI